MRVLKLLTLGMMSLLFISGCQTKADTDIEIEMKSREEQQMMLETYTLEDYRKVFDEAVSEANQLESDKQLTKWIIRTLAEEKIHYETDLTDEEAVELAERQMKEDTVWKSIAKEDYGITITDEEVDEFIKEGPDTSDLPQHQAYADALGLTLEELNHEFDRDLYEKNVMWLKLKPQLEKKYGTADNNKQIERYEEEVRKKIN